MVKSFILLSLTRKILANLFDSKHVEIVLTLDAPEDMDVYEKFGLSSYRQHVLLRITQEARDQNALLTIKDLVKLLKNSYSTIKRDLKYFRKRELYVPLRGIIKDIGPSSHKSKIVELYLKGYTPTEIQRSTRHSLQSIERYIKDFSRVSILTQREESLDNIFGSSVKPMITIHKLVFVHPTNQQSHNLLPRL